MRKALTKPHLRLAGVDDGPFTRRQRTAPLVAVAMSTPSEFEAVQIGRVRVDGSDATREIARLLRSLGPWEGVRAVVLDGVAFGGFNVVDLAALARRVGKPVVAVTRRPPDFSSIRAALRKYFPRDAAARYRRLTARPLFRVPTAGIPLLAACAGCTRTEARTILSRCTRRGFWPEPLRWARLVARAVGTTPAIAPRRPSAGRGRAANP